MRSFTQSIVTHSFLKGFLFCFLFVSNAQTLVPIDNATSVSHDMLSNAAAIGFNGIMDKTGVLPQEPNQKPI